jgi:hypothetical protein
LASPFTSTAHAYKTSKLVPKVTGGFLFGEFYTASDTAGVGAEDKIGFVYGSEASITDYTIWTKASATHELFLGTSQVAFAGQWSSATYMVATIGYSIYTTTPTFVSKPLHYIWITDDLVVHETITNVGETDPATDTLKTVYPLSSRRMSFNYYVTSTQDDDVVGENQTLYVMNIQTNAKVLTINASDLGMDRIYLTSYIKVSHVPITDTDDSLYIQVREAEAPGDYRWRIMELDLPTGNMIRYYPDFVTVNLQQEFISGGQELVIGNGLLFTKYGINTTSPARTYALSAIYYFNPKNSDVIRA